MQGAPASSPTLKIRYPFMWQSLVRNWLYQAARQHAQAAAAQAASGAEADEAPTQPAATPRTPEVCHVGLVFALGIEAGGLTDRLSGVVGTHGAGFVAREGGLSGRRVIVVEAGAGAARAAAGTEALLAGHKPRWVISAGFAGALAPELKRGDILMPDRIADCAGRELEVDFHIDPAVLADNPRLHVGRLLTADRVIADPAEKRAWEFGTKRWRWIWNRSPWPMSAGARKCAFWRCA